jgi:hypothetical protein
MTDVAKERTKRIMAEAKKSFADHEIRESDGSRRWLIQRRHKDDGSWSGVYCAEIFCTARGGIIVEGDIAIMHFAYGPSDVRARLRWMGMNQDLHYYVRQKASMGMRSRGHGNIDIADDFEEELAVADLDEQIQSYKESWVENAQYDLDEGESLPPFDEHEHDYIKAMNEAKSFACDGQNAVYSFLSSRLRGDDYSFFFEETRPSIGTAPSARLIYAHAALHKLCLLLDEQDAEVVDPVPSAPVYAEGEPVNGTSQNA